MDENSKLGGDGGAPKSAPENAVVENPNSATNTREVDGPDDASVAAESNATHPSRQSSSRTPFTNLSQVDADLALARTLQEQERAYMMLTMNGGSSYGSWEGDHYFDDDDEDDYDDPDGHEYDGVDDEDDSGDDDNDEGHDHDDNDVVDDGENGPSSDFPDDEAYARALQDAEEREMAARLLALAGIADREVEDVEDYGAGVNSQDVWEEVDPDELSYEELIALGDVVGTESRGLSADTIASLPSVNYKSEDSKDGEHGTCVICRLEYEEGDTLTVLHCKHSYHSDCITNWLNINKVCPICSTEVSTSGNSQRYKT